MNNLTKFLEEKNITIEEFSQIAGISLSSAYRIKSEPNWNTRAETARLIFERTQEVYGEGLCVYDYLNR